MRNTIGPADFKAEAERLTNSLRFSTNFMDINEDPVEDFYRYASGTWLKNNPIPDDQPFIGAFYLLNDRNIIILADLLEDCRKNKENSQDKNVRMLGTFYESAMDQYTLEKKGFDPILPYINAINALGDKNEIMSFVNEMIRIGIPSFFNVYTDPDKKNSSIYALYIMQGGLSLPDRDYYLLPSFSPIKDKFLEHIKNMFILLSSSKETAEENARRIMDIEDKIAYISRPRKDISNVDLTYNRITMNEFKERFPAINVDDLLKGYDVSPDYVIVEQPDFIESLMKLISTEEMETIKTFLKWRIINFSSPFLHSKAESENFRMFFSDLLGVKKAEPRWKKITKLTSELLGEALGEIYVRREFPEEAERRMKLLVEDIIQSFTDRLRNNSWMSDATKSKALEKLSAFRAKIGHPEKYRDYSVLDLRKNDFFGNILKCREFEMKRQLSRIGKEVDRSEWEMPPQTVNAYFNQTGNEIVFPAGILQPPFFDVTMDDAVNYGAIGSIISHEITHGFDDQGSKFDAQGNINNWWSDSDRDKFSKMASKMVELFSSLEVLPGLKVNGELTLSENIADFGGICIAYDALKRRLSDSNSESNLINGFTQAQIFFISYAQIWRSNKTEQLIRLLVSVDGHSPDSLRGSVPVIYHHDFPGVFNIDSEKAQRLKDAGITPIW